MVVVTLGLVEMAVGIAFIARAQPEALAGLPREAINKRTAMKKLGIPLMVSGILMSVGAVVFWEQL